MKKGKKKPPVWAVVLRGTGVALGIDLAGIALMALLCARGIVGEPAMFPLVAALTLAASMAGGLSSARTLPWGVLPSALLVAGCFAAALLLAGLCCWDTLALNGRGGILLLCVLTGGVAAGLLGSRRKPRRKRA